ncbi:unnamed protein product, partial [Nesidiocoris tenuis]
MPHHRGRKPLLDVPELRRFLHDRNRTSQRQMLRLKPSDQVIEDICKHFLDTCNSDVKRSTVRFIRSNAYHLSRTVNDRGQTYRFIGKKPKVDEYRLLQGITAISPKDNWATSLKETYTASNSVYGSLCTKIGLKNSYLNRKYLKGAWTNLAKKDLTQPETRDICTSESENDIGPAAMVVANDHEPKVVMPVGAVNQHDSATCLSPDEREESPPPEATSDAGRHINFKGCVLFEGETTIPPLVWNDMWKSGKLVNGSYEYYLNAYFAKVNSCCVLLIKNRRINLSNIVIYGYCSHKLCKLFKIILEHNRQSKEDNVRLLVYSNKQHFNHDPSIPATRPLRGVHRRLVEEELQKNLPHVVRGEYIKKASEQLIAEGNADDVRSVNVYRKLRSESMAKKDRDSDDLIDVLLMKRAHDLRGDKFIHSVGEPFSIVMISIEQLDTAVLLAKTAGWVDIHLDSTGNIVRRPAHVEKMVFYYAGVVELPNHRAFPVFEMISAKHDSITISKWLMDVKSFFLSHNHWPIFDRVVLDFSMALIKGVLHSWASMDLFQYLESTYRIIARGAPLKKSKALPIVVKLCCAHLMKNVSKDVNQQCTNKSMLPFVKEAIASLFDLHSIWLASVLVKNLVHILLSPSMSPSVERSVSTVRSICLGNFDETSAIQEIEKAICVPDTLDFSHEMKNSAFALHFSQIIDNERTQVEPCLNCSDNEYFAPQLVETLSQKYLTFYPLWCGSASGPDQNSERCSNAIVENYFGFSKNVNLKAVGRKASRVIRQVRANTVSLAKEFRLGLPKNRSRPKKRQDAVKGVSAPTHQRPISTTPVPSDTEWLSDDDDMSEEEVGIVTEPVQNIEANPEERWKGEMRYIGDAIDNPKISVFILCLPRLININFFLLLYLPYQIDTINIVLHGSAS